MQVFCDFDGTISVQDVTDFILTRFADPEWQEVEKLWSQGTIGSAECMQRQVAMIRANHRCLDVALDAVDIDPSFREFAEFCRSRHIKLTVVSDGVDYFIHRILARYRLSPLPIIANHLEISGDNGDTRYRLVLPFRRTSCESGAGVCKCRCVGAATGPRVYVGDGRSDFCVANKPEVVFAKGNLAAFCKQKSFAFVPYRRFDDVARALVRHSLEMPTLRFARVSVKEGL